MIFESSWDRFLAAIQYPPGSMFFVLALSLVISLSSALLTRLLVDVNQVKRQQDLVKQHQEKKKEIDNLENTNPKKYRKELIRWKRREKSVQKIQQSMSMARLKPTCIQFVPMIVLFFIIRTFFGSGPIACPPMNPWDIPMIGNMAMANVSELGIYPQSGWINFTAWYFLCSFGLNTIVQRTIGIPPQGGMGGLGGGGFASKYAQPK